MECKSYNITEMPYSYSFRINKSSFDKESQGLITRFSVAKFGHVNWKPQVTYPKSIAHSADDAEGAFLSDLVKGVPVIVRVDNKNKPVAKVTLRGKQYHFELTTQYIGGKEKDEPAETKPIATKPTEPVKEQPKPEPVYSEKNPATIEKPAPSIIVDPNSKEAKALIGRRVEISRSFLFTDKRRITLTKIEADSPMPFYGNTIDDGKQVSGVFIREYKVIRTPLDLEDKAVRDSLRGKWIFNKVTGQECLVSSFRKENGHYVCNGLDARTMMNSWELEDGGFLGVEK